MTHESRHMRRPVIQALRKLSAFPIENIACPGTPDVGYIGGFIELKEIDSFPVRPTTPLRLKHFTKQQRLWAKTYILKGGVSTVLLKVGPRHWFLLDGLIAADRLGFMTREEIQSASRLVFTKGLDTGRLLECLTSLTNAELVKSYRSNSVTENVFCWPADEKESRRVKPQTNSE